MSKQQKITPYLWFNGQAKEATELYTSIFPDSAIGEIQYQGDQPFIIPFSLSGESFTAFNGGPFATFNPSISFYVVCESEAEIDQAWAKLIVGGKALMGLNEYPWSKKYGWLEDQFGVSWQLTLGKVADVGQKVSPLLMFTGAQHGRVEEAIELYTSIFENSKVNLISRYEEGEGDPAVGTIKHSQFEIEGYVMMAMESSHMHGFAFNESISFVVQCQGQEEVDYFWDKLKANGGEEMMCGWLKDPFGIAWQIIPDRLMELLFDPDPERALRASGVMMRMRKIDVAALEKAADGEGRPIITIQTTVNAPIDKVWEMWTQPDHVTGWNFASDDWHCPRAESDLRPGGKYAARMEARDGSMGFDFEATFTQVDSPKNLAYSIEDGREVQVHFIEVPGATIVMETFEAEGEHSIEMQQAG